MIKSFILLLFVIVAVTTACKKESRVYNYPEYEITKLDTFYAATFRNPVYNYLDLYLTDGKVRVRIGWRVDGAHTNIINTTYIQSCFYIDRIVYHQY